jgi:hypothetical protein
MLSKNPPKSLTISITKKEIKKLKKCLTVKFTSEHFPLISYINNTRIRKGISFDLPSFFFPILDSRV